MGLGSLFKMSFVYCLSENYNFVKIKGYDSFTHCISNFSYKHSYPPKHDQLLSFFSEHGPLVMKKDVTIQEEYRVDLLYEHYH